ncbi:MAG: TIR domain-containing protein [Desulfosarcinaceae bacterium]|nr:TIR domain-containing protein [Desulfosarcinaceae bacterium]
MANPSAIFISYARSDGANLARRLRRDLEDRGHVPWLDTAAIDGGSSWSRAVEDAIDNCDVALALMSDGAFASDVCRAEQMRLLRKEKRLIPLLVSGNADRQLHLEHLNYRDFSHTGNYEQAFEQLLEDIAGGELVPLPPAMTRTYCNAPKLPEMYLPRPELLAAIRQQVLDDGTEREIALGAVHGMGGIGKTVMALALCHDQVVRDAFPDGVVWVPIGRDPGSLLDRMRIVGTALRDAMTHYDSPVTAASRIREKLRDRAMLLVLDDVWSIDQVAPFLVSAPRCRTLFTTRDANIGLHFGAAQIRLDVLQADEAVSLLAKWSGRDDPAHAEIARRLGYLPLALKLAGAQLRDDWTADEYLESLENVSDIKLDIDALRPDNNLAVCFDLSIDRLGQGRALFDRLGVFAREAWVPGPVVRDFWAAESSGLRQRDMRALITKLDRLALIDRDAENDSIWMHDLIRDHLRERLGERYVETQNAFLEANRTSDAPWSALPLTPYLWLNLAWHLREADRREELLALLTGSPDWLEAKFRACHGDAAFADDLDLALTDLPDEPEPDSLLSAMSLHAAGRVVAFRVEQVVDEDLKILVALDRQEEALNHARLREDASKRCQGLLTIVEALERRGHPFAHLLDEATEIADPRDAPRLATMLANAGQVEEASRWITAIEESKHITNRSNLLRYQIPAELRIGVALARSSDGEDDRARAVFAKCLERIDELKSGRDEMLNDYIFALADAGLVAEAENAALEKENSWRKAESLIDLAQRRIAIDEPEEAERLIKRIEIGVWPQITLVRIARALRDAGSGQRALELLWTNGLNEAIEDPRYQVKALCLLAELRWRKGEYREAEVLLNRAREIASRISEWTSRAYALTDVAISLEETGSATEARSLLAEVVDRVLKQVTGPPVVESQPRDALFTMANQLADARQFSKAESTALAIRSVWRRLEALRRVALKAVNAGEPEAAERMLASVRDISHEERRRWPFESTLALAAGAARSGSWVAAVSWAEGHDEQGQRSDALLTLAQTAADAGRLAEASVIAERIEDLERRARAYAAILGREGADDNQSAAPEGLFNTVMGLLDWFSNPPHYLVQGLVEGLVAAGRREDARRVAKLHDAAIRCARDLALAGWPEDAEKIARQLKGRDDRIKALGQAAAAYFRAGNSKTAESLLSEMRGLVVDLRREEKSAGYDNQEENARISLAIALYECGQMDEAVSIASKVAKAWKGSRPVGNRLQDIAGRLARAGRWDDFDAIATGVIDKRKVLADLARNGALDAARQLAEHIELEDAGADLAYVLAERGEFRSALKYLESLEFDRFVQAIMRWAPALERFSPGLAGRACNRLLDIGGWQRDDEPELRHVLSEEAERAHPGGFTAADLESKAALRERRGEVAVPLFERLDVAARSKPAPGTVRGEICVGVRVAGQFQWWRLQLGRRFRSERIKRRSSTAHATLFLDESDADHIVGTGMIPSAPEELSVDGDRDLLLTVLNFLTTTEIWELQT